MSAHDCQYEPATDGRWRCAACGHTTRKAYAAPPKRNCTAPRPRGLGDLVAWITRLFRVRQCGGCKRRQAKLNRWLGW